MGQQLFSRKNEERSVRNVSDSSASSSILTARSRNEHWREFIGHEYDAITVQLEKKGASLTKIEERLLKLESRIDELQDYSYSLLVQPGAPNENIVQNHLNIALLNVS